MNCHVPDFQWSEPPFWLDVRADYAAWQNSEFDGAEFIIRSLARLLPISEAEIRSWPREKFELVAANLVESLRSNAR